MMFLIPLLFVSSLADCSLFIDYSGCVKAEVTSKCSGAVIIPKEYTCIADYGFTNSQISQVTFQSNSAVTIGSSAFQQAPLRTITAPGGYASIGSYSFDSTFLSTFTLTSSTNYGINVFINCKSLVSVIIKDDMTIPKQMFAGCSKLNMIQGQNYITDIASGAFNGCTALTQFSFDNIKSVGSYAFALSGLHKITLNPTTKFGENAFEESKVASVNFNGADKVVPYMLRDTTQLSILSGLESIKYIQQHAFEGCSKLSSIHLYEGLSTLGEEVFSGSVKTIFYHGTTKPKCDENALSNKVVVYVSDNYMSTSFCTVTVTKAHCSNKEKINTTSGKCEPCSGTGSGNDGVTDSC
ncbi:hypothetical protein EIN_519040 [Entamoeba invadens IP1]|uniref:Leucine rich repeat containing protein BspA family protein n=1 Tax=Entamoeba invadens IP1 TaxID=370355 RepID=A0A0A1U9K1_ENTIV|nr:hypothetical protein EIN_519040 [Entamoeba invadens IP1]ELP91707.1 hypothetical protein EIN_519040 [Entamoeba invadens IP1]|eukprot:XP_004258478.1 hypothetical protein EIN_519040 [Entamoeba invadens IP1]